MSQSFANSIRIRLNRLSRAEFVSVTIASSLVAIAAGAWVAYKIGYFDGEANCGYPCLGSGHRDVFVDSIRLQIAIAFGATAIGITAKRSFSVFLSLVALLFIEIQYAYWYLWSLRWLNEVGLSSFSMLPAQTDIPHAMSLYGATRWDVLLFGIAGALLTWLLKLVVGALQLSRRIEQTGAAATLRGR
jgi:hypothetical protein